MTFYMAFMFSSGLGWDRRLIEVGDWQQIRLPESILIEDNDKLWAEVLRLERWLRENWQAEPNSSLSDEISKVENMLDQTVYQLYGLSEQEVILVEDTLQYSITPFIYRKQDLGALDAFSEPSQDDLAVYAERICLQLNGILRYNNLGL